MRDKTDDIRTVVEHYEGFEFIPLRIEDAFDRSWWNSVGNRPTELHPGIHVSGEGLYTMHSVPISLTLLPHRCTSFCHITSAEVCQSHFFVAKIYIIPPNAHRYSEHYPNSDSIALAIHRCFK